MPIRIRWCASKEQKLQWQRDDEFHLHGCCNSNIVKRCDFFSCCSFSPCCCLCVLSTTTTTKHCLLFKLETLFIFSIDVPCRMANRNEKWREKKCRNKHTIHFSWLWFCDAFECTTKTKTCSSQWKAQLFFPLCV